MTSSALRRLLVVATLLSPFVARAQFDDPGLGPPPSPSTTPAPPTRAPGPPPERAPGPPPERGRTATTPPAARTLPPPSGATSEAPVHEEVKEETKLVPAEPVTDEEWEARMAAPTLTGPIGLLRTTTAEVGRPLHFRIGLHLQAFTEDSFLISGGGGVAGDSDSRFMGDLTLSLTGPDVVLLRNLELSLAVFNSSNQNKRTETQAPGRGDPTVILALADIGLGLKAATEVASGLSIGANVGVRFYNSINGVSAEGGATSATFDALGTFDVRKYAPVVPLRFHVNAGYYLDNSLNLLPSGQCSRPSDLTNGPCIRSRVVETFAYGLNSQRARIALAAELPFEPHVSWGIFGIDLFGEYHVEIATGSGDQTVAKALAGAVDQHRIDNNVSQYLTLGLRLRPVARLVVDAGIDLALESPGFQYGPPLPAWNVIVGAAYTFDAHEPMARHTIRTITKTYETARAPAEGRLTVTVVDARTRKPVPGAIVRYLNRGLSAQATGDDGVVKSYGLAPGPVSVEATRSDYDVNTVEASVEQNAVRTLQIPIKASLREGKLRVRVVDEKGAPLPGATVKVTGTTNKEATLEGDAFLLSVPAGDYSIAIEAPDYLARERQVTVQPNQDQDLEVSLRHRPSTSHVEVTADQILIKGTIHFATREAIILPDGQWILDEVVDVLTKHSEIHKVSVEGHTDNVGGADKNLRLSKDRAAAVVIYLVKNGIARERLTSEGFGATKPLVPNLGAANKAKNRRVEFKILEQNNGMPGFRE
jgi:outer membrane protein OmpA-like peptidoglycan-associated protein